MAAPLSGTTSTPWSIASGGNFGMVDAAPARHGRLVSSLPQSAVRSITVYPDIAPGPT